VDEELEKRALKSACETDDDISDIVEIFLEEQIYRRGVIFRGASDRVRGELMRRVHDPALGVVSRHHLICALAWIDHPEIVELFAAWRRAPPKWWAGSNVPVHDYTLEGGWELTPAGTRRDLCHRACHALVPRTGAAPSPVAVVVPLADSCAWCLHPLRALLDLDSADPACAFLGLPAPRAHVPTCVRCGMLGAVFGHLTALRAWHAANVKPEHAAKPGEDWGDLTGELVLSPQPASPRRAASQFHPVSASQIGGHPTWIQCTEYPVCPGCGLRMTFIGQVDLEDLDDYGEGIFYAFACPGCGVSATGYQQS
jgi:hypothetical protein